jgi:heparan-sulfate lyase
MPASPGPVTTDAQIIAELNLDFPGMEKVKAAVQAGNLPDIEAAYLDFRQHESKVRWKTMPSDKPEAPVEADDKIGDLVAEHNVIRDAYHYGPPVCFMGKDFNWLYNPVPKGDPSYSDEFTWCVVSRTESWQHLADAYWKTGNEKYAKAWVEILEDFALKNPMRTNDPPGASLWRTLDSATRMAFS